MFEFLLSGIFLISFQAFGATEIKIPSKCILTTNQQFMDYGMGYDPDGVALYLDADGKTVMPNADRIVKRNLQNGIETITYKTKQAKSGGYLYGQKAEFETVEKTVVITRDTNGRLVGVSKKYDTAFQAKLSGEITKKGFKALPIIKSIDTNFVYSGDDCALDQKIGVELENEKSKEEKKVYFDKKFCDKLAPLVKQMGSQNAAQCAGLISSAQMAFNSRNEELVKEGKAFKQISYFGQSESRNKDLTSVFEIGSSIQACAMSDFTLYGYGMGSGYPGFGYGTLGGGFGNAYGDQTNTNETLSKPNKEKNNR